MARILYACSAIHGFGGIQRFNRNVINRIVLFGLPYVQRLRWVIE